ncbi:MAG: hypothetical protein NT150_05165 [Bacteroidetes bacterium]|nr:hypothetical protein [Bacteroidota bacterium]
MRILYTISLLLLLTTILSGCDKFNTAQSRMEIAGPKKISRYVWKKMDANGDFSISIYDTLNFGQIIFWDNNDEVINNVWLDTKGVAPAGWYFANVGVGTPAPPIGWYVDFEEGKTLTLWSAESLGGKSRVTYTMTKNLNASKIILETVYFTDKGNFKEILELQSISGNE